MVINWTTNYKPIRSSMLATCRFASVSTIRPEFTHYIFQWYEVFMRNLYQPTSSKQYKSQRSNPSSIPILTFLVQQFDWHIPWYSGWPWPCHMPRWPWRRGLCSRGCWSPNPLLASHRTSGGSLQGWGHSPVAQSDQSHPTASEENSDFHKWITFNSDDFICCFFAILLLSKYYTLTSNQTNHTLQSKQKVGYTLILYKWMTNFNTDAFICCFFTIWLFSKY